MNEITKFISGCKNSSIFSDMKETTLSDICKNLNVTEKKARAMLKRLDPAYCVLRKIDDIHMCDLFLIQSAPKF